MLSVVFIFVIIHLIFVVSWILRKSVKSVLKYTSNYEEYIFASLLSYANRGVKKEYKEVLYLQYLNIKNILILYYMSVPVFTYVLLEILLETIKVEDISININNLFSGIAVIVKFNSLSI
ncbi:hypothetical protein H8356DRAFT_1089023 [Neocallimastix lanati (nom. inval.)]|uniref:Uncharacterized protein n=1 Tax=Neocallimastix californiae TaxID=1754190 RepID=A0A1Y2C6K3_9FUNG|nr:hypothetical protein H8356DRAFT_1089023 [Neocallimastix sp. JGI-2020a]ORY42672.1 hypothetical protein LY90DRAFT_509942 [Neocallimastix californiae]|eukprot:ORY42672.1 hypothetical protein LY90DRAFT_509942 [Neocallimastix californiae]